MGEMQTVTLKFKIMMVNVNHTNMWMQKEWSFQFKVMVLIDFLMYRIQFVVFNGLDADGPAQ